MYPQLFSQSRVPREWDMEVGERLMGESQWERLETQVIAEGLKMLLLVKRSGRW